MSSSLNFGPQWLRNTLNAENGGGKDGGGRGGGGGGMGRDAPFKPVMRSGRAGPAASAASSLSASLGSKLAAMKLAEYRYGKEEMLALFDLTNLSSECDGDDGDPGDAVPEEWNRLGHAHLWVCHAQRPVNLTSGSADDGGWQHGRAGMANSDVSIKSYRGGKSLDPAAAAAHRGRGAPRGARGGPRGFERSLSDRGGSYAPSLSTSGPVPAADDPTNGGVSPRKGYSRAPFDDWRNSRQDDDAAENPGGDWRHGPNGPNGPNGARRWNGATAPGGWRSNANGGAPPPANSRWKDPPESSAFLSRRGLSVSVRGSRGGASVRGRHDSGTDNMPEWAADENSFHDESAGSGTGPADGTFDSEGKFQSGRKAAQEARKDYDDDDWDLAVEEEEVDPDDVGGQQQKDNAPVQNQRHKSESRVPEVRHPEPPEPTLDDSAHLDLVVSKLIDDDDDPVPVPLIAPAPAPVAGPTPSAHVPRPHPHPASAPPTAGPIEWVYLDPSGQSQGPFPSEDMLEWLRAGYFPGDLMVRRTLDKRFVSLHEMTLLHGGTIPFVAGVSAPPPPLESLAEVAAAAEHARAMQQQQMLLEQMRQQMLVQQLAQQRNLMQQQQQQPSQLSPDVHMGPMRMSPLGLHGSASSDAIHNLLLQQQQQQQQHSAASVSAAGGFGSSASVSAKPFNAIQSLLSQLQQEGIMPMAALPSANANVDVVHRRPVEEKTPAVSIWDIPTQQDQKTDHGPGVWQQQQQQDKPHPHQPQPHPSYPHQQQSYQQQHSQEEEPVAATPPKTGDAPVLEESSSEPDFVKATSTSKKTRKSEERKRQRGAKKQAAVVAAASAKADADKYYIPGMEGSVRPDDPVEDGEDDGRQAKQMEALEHLQEEQQQALLRKEQQQQLLQQQQQQQVPPPKLAPWAQKQQKEADDASAASLAEIQRLEEAARREEQQRQKQRQRELQLQQQQQQLLQQKQQQVTRSGWSSVAAANGAASASVASATPPSGLSLAEIQAEEARAERERQERIKKERAARQKEMGAQSMMSMSSVSWASKIGTGFNAGNGNSHPAVSAAKNANTNQRAVNNANGNHGFWDEDPKPEKKPVAQPQPQQPPTARNSNNSKNKSKQATKEADSFSAHNEFDAWCSSALTGMKTDVDIPTFMAFLNDIESPFEVNDYVKSYIGEGKTAKNFAKEYLERRSRHRNTALKTRSRRTHDDDLLTPAVAVAKVGPAANVANANVANANAANNAANGKKRGKAKGKAADASHLLGFSVTSNRVNAGEIEPLPK